MSKFEVGDIIRLNNTAKQFKVVAVLDDKVWAQDFLANGSLGTPLTYDDHLMTKVVPFFEPSTTYVAYNSPSPLQRLEVLRVDTNKDGSLVAYVKVYYLDDKGQENYYHSLRNHFNPESWEKIYDTPKW